VKVLFCARHFGYLRNFDSAIAELARRGHTLHLAADRAETGGGVEMVERLAERCPGITYGWTPPRVDPDMLAFATDVRLTQDYQRYTDRRYDEGVRLRERSRDRTPAAGVRLVDTAGALGTSSGGLLRSVLGAVEDAIPVPSAYTTFLRETSPDVVLFTPLIDLGSPQLDLLKAARRLGLRTALCVGSWDHLSSKALIRIRPDLVTVWNQVQKREAIDMHGLPDGLVAVTGAQCYDQWFDRRPARGRADACRRVGLPPDRPYLLYVCSSPFRGEPPEADLVERWIRKIRAHPDPSLRSAGILVRPHPNRRKEWEGRDLSALQPAVLYGRNPVDDEAREDYFESLWYSAAVVGLNTSAFLEAAVLGKDVHALRPPEHTASQDGTLHFRYLIDEGGGLLRLASSIDDHLEHLAQGLAAPAPADGNRAFVEAFIRPFGRDVPATPRFADAIEHLGARTAPSAVGPALGGQLLAPIVKLAVSARHSRSERQGARRG